jgi:hypothetical protein
LRCWRARSHPQLVPQGVGTRPPCGDILRTLACVPTQTTSPRWHYTLSITQTAASACRPGQRKKKPQPDRRAGAKVTLDSSGSSVSKEGSPAGKLFILRWQRGRTIAASACLQAHFDLSHPYRRITAQMAPSGLWGDVEDGYENTFDPTGYYQHCNLFRISHHICPDRRASSARCLWSRHAKILPRSKGQGCKDVSERISRPNLAWLHGVS